MNFINSLKSSGSVDENFSAAKNQHADIERMFQGYPQNPYIAQHTEDFDNAYYPGHVPGNGYGLKYGSTGHGYGDNGFASQHYPPPHVSGHGEVHSYNPGHMITQSYSQHTPKSKGHSAMSALTLLAFLFFLNILQSCLKEHMMTMNPTVMIMTAGASRRTQHRTNDENAEPNDSQSDYQVFSPKEDEMEHEPDLIEFAGPFHTFFNQSDIKKQNAVNFYKRKPHKA